MGQRGKQWVVDRQELQDKHANICMDMILEFKAQLKFSSDVEECECDHRRLSDYNLQQFRCYIQKKKVFKL